LLPLTEWVLCLLVDFALFHRNCDVISAVDYYVSSLFRLTQYSLDGDLDRQLNETKEITINAGQLVWAVAFGSQVPLTCPRSTNLNWSRRIDDTILATGLQSGCIKTWDAKSGI